MTDEEIEAINKEYDEYYKRDVRWDGEPRLYHLPFIIWLKHKKKINPSDYYGKDYQKKKEKDE